MFKWATKHVSALIKWQSLDWAQWTTINGLDFHFEEFECLQCLQRKCEKIGQHCNYKLKLDIGHLIFTFLDLFGVYVEIGFAFYGCSFSHSILNSLHFEISKTNYNEVAKVVFLAQILIDRRSNEHAQHKRPTDQNVIMIITWGSKTTKTKRRQGRKRRRKKKNLTREIFIVIIIIILMIESIEPKTYHFNQAIEAETLSHLT